MARRRRIRSKPAHALMPWAKIPSSAKRASRPHWRCCASARVDLDGVVRFHGSLPVDDPPKPGEVKAEVLVLHGAADGYVMHKAMATFKQQMTRADADINVISYPGAKQSFTNPAADQSVREFGLEVAYDTRADRQPWRKMRTF
jgi:dienelactone hydrolase